MSSRLLIAGFLTLLLALPAAAADPPPADTPQDAVAAVKRVLKRNTEPCELVWTRIQATGYEDDWVVDVRVRDSEAGRGLARWHVVSGEFPKAANALARHIARGCR